MIAKLICLIAVLTGFAFFMGYNLDNKCDIWLFTKTLKDVPVFMNSLISFAIGVMCALPFAFVRKIKTQKKMEEREAEREEAAKRKASKKAAKASKAPGEDKASGAQASSDTGSKTFGNTESGKTKREKILERIQKLKKQSHPSETEQEAE